MSVTVTDPGPDGHRTFLVRLHPTRADWPRDMTASELAALQVHADGLRAAAANGRCALAGPLLDGSLGVAVWDGVSLGDVLAHLREEDPMVVNGYFAAEVCAMRLSYERP